MIVEKFLMDVLKRHKRFEVAQKAAMIELEVIRDGLLTKSGENSGLVPLDKLEDLIKSEKVTVSDIL